MTAAPGDGEQPPGIRKVTLLTGARGAGKSTICLRLAALARAAGIAVAGIASRSRWRQGLRAGLDAVDLATGESWLLASVLEPQGGPAVGPFSFNPSGLHRAFGVLEQTLDRDRRPETRLLVLDEVGPLELTRHEGFYPFVARLGRLPSPDLLLVVRPALVEALRTLVDRGLFAVVEVTPDTRDALPQVILAAADAGTA